uniref:Immunoglobulin domain-containing protein n=1 Tax=Corvus moneduloides TaxID=1196302 RepID=A0A8C3EKS8_CORMO
PAVVLQKPKPWDRSPLHLLIPCPVPTELRLPRPDLSVLPGHKVTVGADVMLRCTPTHPSTGCYLYLEGQIRAQLLPREQGDYNLSHVQKGDGGRYSCQCYAINASREWSAVSRTLDLVVRGETSPSHILLYSSSLQSLLREPRDDLQTLQIQDCWPQGQPHILSQLSVTIWLAVASEGQLHVLCSFPSSVPLGGVTGERLRVGGVPGDRDVGGAAGGPLGPRTSLGCPLALYVPSDPLLPPWEDSVGLGSPGVPPQ